MTAQQQWLIPSPDKNNQALVEIQRHDSPFSQSRFVYSQSVTAASASKEEVPIPIKPKLWHFVRLTRKILAHIVALAINKEKKPEYPLLFENLVPTQNWYMALISNNLFAWK